MDFEKSGLKTTDEIVQHAFMASWNRHAKDFQNEARLAVEDLNAQIDAEIEAASHQLPPEQLEHVKLQLEQQRRAIEDRLVKQIAAQRDMMFDKLTVGPARVLEQNSENPSPELLAAVLLIPTVRSPLDAARVSDEYSPAIAGVISEYLDIQAYPTEKADKLPTASADCKRIAMAMLVDTLQGMAAASKRMQTGAKKVVLLGGRKQAEKLIETATLARDNDAKLDELFVKSFNQASEAMQFGLKISVGDDGTLKTEKVKIDPPPMPPAMGPGGPPMGGGPINPFGGPPQGGSGGGFGGGQPGNPGQGGGGGTLGKKVF